MNPPTPSLPGQEVSASQWDRSNSYVMSSMSPWAAAQGRGALSIALKGQWGRFVGRQTNGEPSAVVTDGHDAGTVQQDGRD